MMEWWESLSMFGRVLACIAIPSTLLLLIQTILAMIGIGGGEDSDAGFDADADAAADSGTEGADTIFGNDIPDGSDLDTIDAGLRLLSLRSIIAFSAVFSPENP